MVVVHWVVHFDIDDTLTVPACDVAPAGVREGLALCQSTQGVLMSMLELCSSRPDVAVYLNTARSRPSVKGMPSRVAAKVDAMGPDVLYYDVDERKTSRAIALKKVAHLYRTAIAHGAPRHRVVLVDDNKTNCDAAEAYGFRAVWVPRGATPTTLRSFAEILAER